MHDLMLTFIVLYLPAVLFAWCYENLTKTDLSIKKLLYLYAFGNVGTNMLCWLALRFVFDKAHDPLYNTDTDMLPADACFYLLMAVVFSLILAVLCALLAKTFSVSIEDTQHEK